MAQPPQGLLSLPNELLREVVAPLSPADLRHLREVNHRALDFILDYSRPCFTGLAELPNVLILEVVAHLTDRDRSRLARTNFRFCSLIMDDILDQEVRTQGVKLLESALRTKSRGLVRRLLLKGADIETGFRHIYFWRYGGYWSSYTTTPLASATWRGDVTMVELLLQSGANVHTSFDHHMNYGRGPTMRLCTPLFLAAYRDHERIVELLMEAGASPVVEGDCRILSVTIDQRHESIVSLLLQNLSFAKQLSASVIRELIQMASGQHFRSLSTNVIIQHEHVILRHLPPASVDKSQVPEYILAEFIKCAATGKLAMVVSHLLQIRGRLQLQKTSYLDAALQSVISLDARKESVLKRELHQDVFQIVQALLAHGADPDSVAQGKSARDMATAHPDPRVRNRLVRIVHPSQPTKELPSLIRRSLTTPSKASSTDRRPQHDRPSASLWDFVGSRNQQGPRRGHGSDEISALESKDVVTSGGQTQGTAMSAPTTRAIISEEQTKLQTNAASPPHLDPQNASSELDSAVPTKSVWASASSKIRSAPTVKEQVSMEKPIIRPKPMTRMLSPHRHRVEMPFGYQQSKDTSARKK